MDGKSLPQDDKEQMQNELQNDLAGLASQSPVLRLPLFLFNMLVSGIRLLKPLAPQLIPLTVFALAIPIVVFFSLSAGWFVWRSIAIGWEADVYLQYGDGLPPHAWIPLPSLVAHQPYGISAHLVVPASEANFALGNFMVKLTMFTSSNKTIASIRMPAIVTPPNPSLVSLLYRNTGRIDLVIPLFSSFETGSTHVMAHFELGRGDQWRSVGTGEGREVSVSSAFLRGVVITKGFRGLITRFPLFSAMVSSATFLFVSFIILASCILPAVEWRLHSNNDGSDAESTLKSRRRPRRLQNESTDAGDRSSQKSRSQKRSRSVATPRRASRDDFKAEDIAPPIIPPPVSSTPLRRRRSHLSHSESEA